VEGEDLKGTFIEEYKKQIIEPFKEIFSSYKGVEELRQEVLDLKSKIQQRIGVVEKFYRRSQPKSKELSETKDTKIGRQKQIIETLEFLKSIPEGFLKFKQFGGDLEDVEESQKFVKDTVKKTTSRPLIGEEFNREVVLPIGQWLDDAWDSGPWKNINNLLKAFNETLQVFDDGIKEYMKGGEEEKKDKSKTSSEEVQRKIEPAAEREVDKIKKQNPNISSEDLVNQATAQVLDKLSGLLDSLQDKRAAQQAVKDEVEEADPEKEGVKELRGKMLKILNSMKLYIERQQKGNEPNDRFKNKLNKRFDDLQENISHADLLQKINNAIGDLNKIGTPGEGEMYYTNIPRAIFGQKAQEDFNEQNDSGVIDSLEEQREWIVEQFKEDFVEPFKNLMGQKPPPSGEEPPSKQSADTVSPDVKDPSSGDTSDEEDTERTTPTPDLNPKDYPSLNTNQLKWLEKAKTTLKRVRKHLYAQEKEEVGKKNSISGQKGNWVDRDPGTGKPRPPLKETPQLLAQLMAAIRDFEKIGKKKKTNEKDLNRVLKRLRSKIKRADKEYPDNLQEQLIMKLRPLIKKRLMEA